MVAGQRKIDNSTLSSALEILQSVFGFEDFRDRQAEIVERTLAGGHSLVVMPTGAGKSVCFQVPALVLARRDATQGGAGQVNVSQAKRRPLTVVLSPLIALMKDQVDGLIQRGVDATFINSSLSASERIERYQNLASGKHDLLYVTPERFRKTEFTQAIAQRQVVLLAVDEAHCISQWGHDFRPDYTRAGEIRRQLGNPPTIALTATATRDVQRDIVQQLGLSHDEVVTFHSGIERPNLSIDVVEVWGDDDKLKHLRQVFERNPGTGIVYFTLIKTLYRFHDYLDERRVPHLIYHGELPRGVRRAIQEQFIDEEDHLVLATNAFGMGIDKADIRFVVHADLPGSLESYYQEIGRAGRDGLPAECLLLYDQSDLATQMEFMHWSNPDVDFYARLHDLLEHERDAINAFGLEWLREKLHAKQKHDRRLETAMGMLERFGVVEGGSQPPRIETVGQLPPELRDGVALAQKLERDQRKLLSLVQFARTTEDRREFLRNYFS